MISKLALERIVKRLRTAGHEELAAEIERDWASVSIDMEMDELEKIRAKLKKTP